MRFSRFLVIAQTALLVAAGQRQCGSDLSNVEIAAAEAQFTKDEAATSNIESRSLLGGTSSPNIKVHFHVVNRGPSWLPEGNVPDSVIRDQIRVLNKDFRKTGLTFTLVNTTRTYNPNWFVNAVPRSATQDEMKRALRTGGRADLNVFSVGFEDPAWFGLLGYATYPWNITDRFWDDGVAIVAGSLPGGDIEDFNLGATLTHEVGHWVGLYHTFSHEQSCDDPADRVFDTPPQSEASTGCPIGKDSCPGGGLDPIHNYMDYSDDACYTEFTLGQILRMRAVIRVYRGIRLFF